MDFFQNQEDAQRKTGLLIFYYIMAVVMIIFGLYAALVVVFVLAGAENPQLQHFLIWDLQIFSIVTFSTLLIIFSGTIYKVRQLSAGGKAVANLLGARHLINPKPKDPKEKMLLNIVEEMSIASGMQIPQTFILDREPGINAFAAGFNPDDAVIGVTKGCLDKLSRDELQGVIAHEFSHILYGDMRINIKLMGVLHGILIIAFLGYIILRSTLYAPRGRSSGKGGNPLPLILFGLAMVIIGSIGVFFGNLIKSAVSRQREYLADASAVQFTRNPSGIAGALKKIAGIAKSSAMQCKHAQEANHLFFANSAAGFMSGLMSTHPPLPERIKRLEPSFKSFKASQAQTTASAQVSGFAGNAPSKFNVQSQDIVSSVGTTQQEHISYASKVLNEIPDKLLETAHSLPEAESIVYSLLFSQDNQIKEKQIQLLKKETPTEAFKTFKDISSLVQNLPVEYRLPLLDITISTLKKTSFKNYQRFKNTIQQMIAADGKVSLFEYTVRAITLSHLKPAFEKPLPPKIDYRSLKPLKSECSLLLSYLAHYGVDDDSQKTKSFAAAASKLDIINPSDFMPTEKCSLKEFDQAIDKLNRTAFRLKKKIIDASVTCVIADGWITNRQAELIRVAADAIGCPLPPLSPGKQTL